MLEIRYPNGRMVLNRKEFFPCGAVRARKLARVIEMNYDISYIADRFREIVDWETEQIRDLDDPDRKRELANTCVDYGTLAAETQPEIEKQEHMVEKLSKDPVFVQEYRREKDMLKTMKARQKDFISAKKSYEREFNGREKKSEKYKKDLAVFREALERYSG